jgi:TPR repeat protein
VKKILSVFLCLISANHIVIADDTETQLKATIAERNAYKGARESFYSENCPKQLDFWMQAAQQGQAMAQALLGNCYYLGTGVSTDEAQAVTWFHKAAEQGDADAQIALGTLYLTGSGVTKDELKAAIWYSKAAEQGNANAQVRLGTLYLLGQGVTKDNDQAVMWFRKAAEQGNADAQEHLKFLQ